MDDQDKTHERRHCEEQTYGRRVRCQNRIQGTCSCGMRLCTTHLGTHARNMQHEEIVHA